MKLLEMHKPFMEMTPEERMQFIRSYRGQRERDLSTVKPRRSPLLSEKERALLKKIGIKLSDLASLKGGQR